MAVASTARRCSRSAEGETPLLEAIRECEELLDRYRSKHLPRARAKVVEAVQPELFEMGVRR